MKRRSRAIVALTGRRRRSVGRAELRGRLSRAGGDRGCAGICVAPASAGRPV